MSQSVLLEQPGPASLGAYRVERILVAEQTWLARSPGGRLVVLKRLPHECLLHDDLHPEIRDRLERVRELAHVGVANLHGVERDGGIVFAVWEYVEGRTLDEYLQHRHGSAPRQLAHELVLSVQSLHALGINHGSIHGRNVVITPTGALRLTHLSPLLYVDPDVDMQGLLDLLPALGCRDEIADLDCNTPLRQLGLRVLAWSRESRCAGPDCVDAEAQSRWTGRRAAFFGALALAVAGALLSWGIATHADRQEEAPQSPDAAAARTTVTPPPGPSDAAAVPGTGQEAFARHNGA